MLARCARAVPEKSPSLSANEVDVPSSGLVSVVIESSKTVRWGSPVNLFIQWLHRSTRKSRSTPSIEPVQQTNSGHRVSLRFPSVQSPRVLRAFEQPFPEESNRVTHVIVAGASASCVTSRKDMQPNTFTSMACERFFIMLKKTCNRRRSPVIN